MADSTPPAPASAAPQHKPADCAACRIADTLEEHRNATASDWSYRRATLNFAIIIARRECPAYQRAWAVDA